MAKFELKVYDKQSEDVIATCKRTFIPVSLCIKCQELNEKLQKEDITSDAVMFAKLKDLFVETFSDLSADEYENGVDTAEILIMFRDILQKATQITTKN